MKALSISMKRWALVGPLFVGLGPLAWGAGLPAGTEIKVCDDASEWPPYTEWERRDGQPTAVVVGRSVRVLQRIAQARGWRLQIELLPWKRCLAEVQEGVRAHMLLNAAATPQRQRDYLLTSAYHQVNTVVLWSRRVHPDGLALSRLEDLARYRIGGALGYNYPSLQRLGIPLSSQASHHGNLVQMLHHNRIDAVLVAREVMPSLRGLNGQPLSADPYLGQGPVPGAPPTDFHMLITRRGPLGPELHAALETELKRLRASGELARLMGGN